MSNIGFIGLGIMGKPMAGNLIKGEHTLFLHSRSGVPQELAAAGGKACSSEKEVAQKADIIITMVPDTPDVERVLFGHNGVAEGLSRGETVVDMSSISPIETKKFAKKINELGCEYVDAPVSGGEVGAKNAALTIMVGGNQATFDKVKPVFELMGKNITLVGGNGDGQTCKVCNQIRLEAWPRSRQGAPVPDGRLRRLAHPGSARRAHDQAHVRSGIPDRIAPKGSQPCPGRSQSHGHEPAEHRHHAAA